MANLHETYTTKTRRMGLPYGENFIMLPSTVFDWSTRVTDGQWTEHMECYAHILRCHTLKNSVSSEQRRFVMDELLTCTKKSVTTVELAREAHHQCWRHQWRRSKETSMRRQTMERIRHTGTHRGQVRRWDSSRREERKWRAVWRSRSRGWGQRTMISRTTHRHTDT